jgi:hypothetical protein
MSSSSSAGSCFIALDHNLSRYTSEAQLLCSGQRSSAHGYIAWSSHQGCWEQFHNNMHPGKHCATDYLVTLSEVSITQAFGPAWGRQYWMEDKAFGRHGLGVRLGLDCPSWPPEGGVTFVDMYAHRVAAEFGPRAESCDEVVHEHLCALTPMDLWNVREQHARSARPLPSNESEPQPVLDGRERHKAPPPPSLSLSLT